MTDSLKGRRLGAVIYAPRSTDTGDICYVDANGRMAWLAIPADYAAQESAGTPYRLGIVSGLPAWIATETVGASAWVYMTTIDETGATVLMTDDDGSPILTLIPT